MADFEDVFDGEDERPEVKELFNNIKNELPELTQLLAECSDFVYEDSVYRFYHGSWKVYFLQKRTIQIVEKFQSLLPDSKLNEVFVSIINEGTNKKFKRKEANNEAMRSIVESFFHAKYFLEMVVKYGNELEFPPNTLPSGWASVLYLYNMRH